MRLTPYNVQSVLGVYPERLFDVLPEVFSKLLEPDQDDIVLQNYAGAINERFEKSSSRPDGQVKLDSFGEAAFESGIVKTMMTLTQLSRPTMPCAIAAHHALDSIVFMMRTANTAERRDLLEQLLENDVVDVCLDKVLNHSFCIHRTLGTNVLRSLTTESFLGEYLSSAQTSDVMVKMCQFVLSGPEFFTSQLGSPSTTWQSSMILGNLHTPMSKAARYAPRYYAMAQENAMWAIHGLLCRSPPPSPQFCADVLNHDPELIDLLFKCAVIARPPWYPESQVDSIACENLVLLFRISPSSVLGVPDSFNSPAQQKIDDGEWKGSIDSLKVLTSRPNWVEMIIGVWAKVENERWQDIQSMTQEVTSKYFAQTSVGKESLLQIFEYRGTSRICMLRIIATLTHASDQCHIADKDFLPLLRIGYAASGNVKTIQQLSSEVESYVYLERSVDIFRTPMYTVFTLDKVDPPEQIPDESVMGPIALSRLLAVLAQRKVLEDIPNWKKLPDGTSSSITLTQLRHITEDDSLRPTLSRIVKRVTEHREVGHKRIRGDNEVDYAGFAYASAAELAAAIIAFDDATNGKYKDLVHGIRKELVLCLGNAAEMALTSQLYCRSLNFALCACMSAQDLPPTDAVGHVIIAKNQRRAERARAGIAGQ